MPSVDLGAGRLDILNARQGSEWRLPLTLTISDVAVDLTGGTFDARLLDPNTTIEEQTITEGGSGLSSFTLSYRGQTTASVDVDASASDVQSALTDLTTIDSGDVTVTGSGPYVATFTTQLARLDRLTATPTGGSGTITVRPAPLTLATLDVTAVDLSAGAVLVGKDDTWEVDLGRDHWHLLIDGVTSLPARLWTVKGLWEVVSGTDIN